MSTIIIEGPANTGDKEVYSDTAFGPVDPVYNISAAQIEQDYDGTNFSGGVGQNIYYSPNPVNADHVATAQQFVYQLGPNLGDQTPTDYVGTYISYTTARVKYVPDTPQSYVDDGYFGNKPVGTNAGNDTIENLSGLPGHLDGGPGSDTLIAGTAGDTLDGGSGADILVGGAGNDTFYVDNYKDVIVSVPGQGDDTLYVSAPFKLTAAQNIEHVYLEGPINLAFTANQYTQTITGDAQVNTLNDGGYAVTMAGGDNTDLYIVHNAGSQVIETPTGGYDTVETDLSSYTLPANVEALTYIGTSSFTGTGNSGKNVITGGSGDDVLDGGAGGPDRLIGGAGNDVYYVHNLNDTVIEQPNQGFADLVYSYVSGYIMPANVEGMIVDPNHVGVSFGVNSQGGFDFLAQDPGLKLVGGPGGNTFEVLAGNTTMTGGAGSDTFYFNAVNEGADRITNFQPGIDRLVLDHSGPTYGDPILGFFDTGSTLAVPKGLSDDLAYHAIEYDKTTGDLYYDYVLPDFVHGGAVTIDRGFVIATFDGHPNITSADVFL